jgi:hypothetical protein
MAGLGILLIVVMGNWNGNKKFNQITEAYLPLLLFG